METKNKMGTMAMPKLIINMSLPLMISLLVQSLYNIVDSVFVARIGEDALTATSLAFPVQLLMIAVAVGTSVGINALLSKSIGAKDYEVTENIAATGVILAGAGTLAFVILGIFCSGWFVSLFTDEKTIGAFCEEYLSICMIFCAGTFVGTMFQRFLQSIGDTYDSMVTLIAGALTNLILDPIFIFGLAGLPAYGIKGAAMATVIGQWVAAILAIILNKTRNPYVNIRFRGYRPKKSVLKQIYKVGLPTIITQAIGSVMVTTVNAILMPFSSTAVAFFGVYYKMQNFLFMPMNGLGQAAIPIVGYNYGAKNKERVHSLFRTIIPMAAGIALLATIIFLIFPEQLLNLFSASETMLQMGIPALRIISVTFAFASITMVLGYSVSGMGNGMVNMLGTALRQFVVLVPVLYILVKYAGISYGWYAFWVSEVIAVVYAIWAARKELREKA